MLKVVEWFLKDLLILLDAIIIIITIIIQRHHLILHFIKIHFQPYLINAA